jgi:ion channel-forming bestrophin family protein
VIGLSLRPNIIFEVCYLLLFFFRDCVESRVAGELGIYYEDLYHLIRPLHVRSILKSSRHSFQYLPKQHGNDHEPKSHGNHLDNPHLTIPVAGSTSHHHPHQQTEGTATTTATVIGSSTLANSSQSSLSNEHVPLLPAQMQQDTGMLSDVSRNLIPFESFFHWVHSLFKRKPKIELPTVCIYIYIHSISFS